MVGGEGGVNLIGPNSVFDKLTSLVYSVVAELLSFCHSIHNDLFEKG